jgi:outer membrane protein assembly factor BamB
MTPFMKNGKPSRNLKVSTFWGAATWRRFSAVSQIANPPFVPAATPSDCHPEGIRRGCPIADSGLAGKDLNASTTSKHNFARVLSLLSFLYVLYLPSAVAEHTRTWRQASYEDFLKGTPHGVAVRSDGRLELAPKFTLIAGADASYLWSLRVDPKGALYAAGGSPAKVFRFDTNGAGLPVGAGKPATVFESTDLVAQAIAFDSKGALYVATSPDGKVYRVSAAGEKAVFFDPKAKYIWDLAFGPDGTLYVATGDKGQIFAVAPDGKGELFYASDEAHIRVLAFDTHNTLLAGTEPSGRILRVTRSQNKNRKEKDSAVADGFVLYETAKREVTALAVAPDGNIYAAAIGEKQRPTPQAPTTVITTPQGTTTITGGAIVLGPQPQGQTPFIPFPQQLFSSIYRLSPEGAPEELWNSRDDVVYSLALNSDGRLLAGTGNNGALLAIDGRGVFAQLAKAGSAQITGIARSSAGKLFLCTANPGKVFSVGPEFEPEGTFESRSFDAQLFSKWGRLDWWSPPAAPSDKPAEKSSGAPRVEFFVRSGNTEDPGKEWSRWFGPYSKPGGNAECPPARFVQWKAVIHDGRSGDGVSWVSLAYLPRNVAPVIDGIAVQDPGVRAQANIIIQTGQPPSVNLRQPQTSNPAGVVVTQSAPARFEQPPQGFRDKGFQSVLWSAHDDNDDELRFSVYFRGENETDWKLLKDKLEQKFYSWDSTAMPDGAYYLKIVATDSLSNPPAEALTTERESERFVVDNTPPVIEGLKARPGKSQSDPSVEIQFTARDTTSSIERAQYSVDGGDWIIVSPKGKISDAPEEHYEFSINLHASGAAASEHTIAVRVYDHFENVGSAKTTVKVP